MLHFKKEETNSLGVADEEQATGADVNPWPEPSQPSLSQSTAPADEGTTVAAHLENKKRRIEELSTRSDIYELLARSVGTSSPVKDSGTQFTIST